MTKPILGWHFLAKRGELRGGAPAADPSGMETFSGEVRICGAGLHASARAIDALRLNPGGWTLRRVEMVPLASETDKFVGNSRRVLWTADAGAVRAVVLEWARWCAEQALALVKDDTEERQVAILGGLLALEVARDPTSTRADLWAARDAAYAAAADAAYAAAAAADAAYAADAAAAYAADAAYAAYAAAQAPEAARQAMRQRLNDELESRLLALAPQAKTEAA